MTDETEALRKRVEELDREVNDLRIAIWSRPITPAHPDYYNPYPAIERWKQPAKVTCDELSGPWKVTMHDGTTQIYKVLPV